LRFLLVSLFAFNCGVSLEPILETKKASTKDASTTDAGVTWVGLWDALLGSYC
jgi:hypothetical protein